MRRITWEFSCQLHSFSVVFFGRTSIRKPNTRFNLAGEKSIKRRDFIRLGAASSAAAVAVSTIGCRTIPLNRARETVVVIGGGIAGIAAARTLHDEGYEVSLIEARNRLGGRIHTDRSLGTAIELGASRIHGAGRNPVTTLARQYGVRLEKVDWTVLSGYETDGTPLDERYLGTIYDKVYNTLFRAVIRTFGTAEDRPVEEIIQEFRSDRNATPAERRMFEFGLGTFEILFGASLRDLSFEGGKEYEEYRGGDHLVINGLDTVPKQLAMGLDISMGNVVRSVEYGRNRVRVHTDDGTLQADRVIVTVPLGVLKANSIVFTPELPVEKLDAIGQLGMGYINKFALRFPRPFWPKDDFAIAHASDHRGKYSAFVNAYRFTNEPILVGQVGSSFKNGLEGLSDEQVLAEAVDVLRGMYGTRVPDPTSAVRTRWASDPFAFGAQSYNKFGVDSGPLREALAQPVDDRIFFAGEATDRKRYGSLSGAYKSGLRAAQELMNVRPAVTSVPQSS